MNDQAKTLLMGKIGAPHGIRGQVRITPFTQNADDIAAYGPLSTNRAGLTITIAELRVQKNIVIARLKDVKTREAAEKLNGVELYIERARLPDPDDAEDFYHADLIGLEARIDDGTIIGDIIALPNFGAGDLIEIRDPRSGDTFLYPFTKAVVPQIRIAEGYITITVPTDADPGEEEPG